MLSETETRRLLNDLCVTLGFCLPPDEISRFVHDPPRSVRAFTDAVFLAEGLDAVVAGRHLYRQVRDMVAAAFERSANVGE